MSETTKKATEKKATTPKASTKAAVKAPAAKAVAKPATKKVAAKTESGPQLVPARVPTQEEIRQRAYEIWAGRGYSHGNHTHDWRQAEQELKRA